MNRIDIITVAHAPELQMLRMQARSLRLFLAPALVGTILVVNNDADQARFRRDFLVHVLAEYGQLAASVRFIDRSEILPGFEYSHGWHTQQVIKFIAASRSRQDYCLILDAKNHFVRPINARSFQAEDGRLKSCLLSQRGHLESLFRNSFAYFRVDPDKFIDQTLPNVTPMPLRSSTVQEMLKTIEVRERCSFAMFFLGTEALFAEFYLLAGYIAARDGSFDKEYAFAPPSFVTVFPDKANAGAFQSLMWQLNTDHALTFAIHWAARPVLPDELKQAIARFWCERGLISDPGEAAVFLAG